MIVRAIKRVLMLAAGLAGFGFLLGGLAGVALRSIPAAIGNIRREMKTAGVELRETRRRGFKRGVRWTVVALIVGGGGLGLLVWISGIVPTKASSGHWPVTEWFLNIGKERSVATHSIGIKTPSLNDPDLILKGAVHYDIGCRSCHGRPGMKYPRIARSMTPMPPYLPPELDQWDSAGLFHIVKHGIKFTGMPAWPALERDDEVWAVVAFLRKLPELDEAAYLDFVDSRNAESAPMETMGLAPATTRTILLSCARCHGHDGVARGNGAFPNLAGQSREYLERSLVAYIEGDRHSGIMEPIAAGLDPMMIKEISAYYAMQEPEAADIFADDAELERGREIARSGIPEKRVPACLECHDPGGRKAKDVYPTLSGQPADYLVLQLELFKKRQRGGTEYAHLMHHVVDHLEPADMRAAARYFESLPPGKP